MQNQKKVSKANERMAFQNDAFRSDKSYANFSLQKNRSEKREDKNSVKEFIKLSKTLPIEKQSQKLSNLIEGAFDKKYVIEALAKSYVDDMKERKRALKKGKSKIVRARDAYELEKKHIDYMQSIQDNTEKLAYLKGLFPSPILQILNEEQVEKLIKDVSKVFGKSWIGGIKDKVKGIKDKVKGLSNRHDSKMVEKDGEKEGSLRSRFKNLFVNPNKDPLMIRLKNVFNKSGANLNQNGTSGEEASQMFGKSWRGGIKDKVKGIKDKVKGIKDKVKDLSNRHDSKMVEKDGEKEGSLRSRFKNLFVNPNKDPLMIRLKNVFSHNSSKTMTKKYTPLSSQILNKSDISQIAQAQKGGVSINSMNNAPQSNLTRIETVECDEANRTIHHHPSPAPSTSISYLE